MDAILKYPNAQAFFDKLVSNGVEPDALVTVLQNAAQFERRGEGDEAITPEGIPLYTIKRLPKRLEEMASTIERIEAHQHWTVQRGIIPRLPGEATTDELARLPKLLREYAFDLAVTAGFNPKIQATINRLIPHTFRCQLVEHVEKITGRPHYEDVATLLTAALHADGQEKDVTPESLRAYRSRHPESESETQPSADV